MRRIGDFEQWNEGMSRRYNIDTYRERSHWFIRWVENLRDRVIVKYLDPRPEDHTIDLGCGGGHLLSKIETGRLTGIDLSDFSLALAKSRLGDRVELVKGDVTALPPGVVGRKFDKIACSEVIEHVLSPENVIEEILRIATPASVIVISAPNERMIDLIKRIFISMRLFPRLFPNIPESNTDEWHLWDFDKALFERIVKGKLIIKKTRRIPFSMLAIRYVFVCRVAS